MEHRLARGLAVTAIAVLVLDQLAKTLVRANVTACGSDLPQLCEHVRLGPLWLVNIGNPGTTGFGQVPLAFPLLTMLLIPLYGARVATLEGTGWRVPVALGLLAGGALGNMVDRLGSGVVTDFLSPGRAVTFNLADVAIVAGTVMTIRLLVLVTQRARVAA